MERLFSSGAMNCNLGLTFAILTSTLMIIKPKTININGYEVPEPVRTRLNDGDTYYIPDVLSYDFYISDWWSNTDQDLKFLNLGLIHLTKEAAIQHAKALLSFTAKVDN